MRIANLLNIETVDRTQCNQLLHNRIICIGEFAALTRNARKTRDFTELDAAIKEKIRPYLYNNGEGRYIPSSELIHVRRYVMCLGDTSLLFMIDLDFVIKTLHVYIHDVFVKDIGKLEKSFE